MSAKPFQVNIRDEVLEDLSQRLARTRWPDQLPESAWEYGTDLGYLRDLVAYWIDGFNWRQQEALLNRWPQFTTTVDGVDLHFVHVRGKSPA